jgi:hypothetical protein
VPLLERICQEAQATVLVDDSCSSQYKTLPKSILSAVDAFPIGSVGGLKGVKLGGGGCAKTRVESINKSRVAIYIFMKFFTLYSNCLPF